LLDLLEKEVSIEVAQKADALLPSLDVVGGYTFSESRFSVSDNDQVYAGLSGSLPLFNPVAKADLAIAKLAKRKIDAESMDTRNQLYLSGRILFEEMSFQKELLAILAKKETLAKAILKEETENYSFGKITLNDYISAVNAVDAIRFQHITISDGLRRSVLAWLQISDQLVKTLPASPNTKN